MQGRKGGREIRNIILYTHVYGRAVYPHVSPSECVSRKGKTVPQKCGAVFPFAAIRQEVRLYAYLVEV